MPFYNVKINWWRFEINGVKCMSYVAARMFHCDARDVQRELVRHALVLIVMDLGHNAVRRTGWEELEPPMRLCVNSDPNYVDGCTYSLFNEESVDCGDEMRIYGTCNIGDLLQNCTFPEEIEAVQGETSSEFIDRAFRLLMEKVPEKW